MENYSDIVKSELRLSMNSTFLTVGMTPSKSYILTGSIGSGATNVTRPNQLSRL